MNSLLSAEVSLLPSARTPREGKNLSIGGKTLSRGRPGGGELSRDDAAENERILGGGVGNVEGRKKSALRDLIAGGGTTVGVASERGGTGVGASGVP